MKRLFTISSLLFLSLLANGQKRVLVEKFTNAYCGACPQGSINLEEYQAENPGTILVKHHKYASWTERHLSNPESQTLRRDLGVWGNPTAMVDRKAELGGNVVTGINSCELRIKNQINEPHYARLSFTDAEFNAVTQTLEFGIEVIFDELPQGDDFRLSVMVVEDDVWGVEQHSYYNDVVGHPLEGRGDIIWDYKHTDVVRAILIDPWGSAEAFGGALETGVSYKQSFSYKIPEGHRMDFMRIVSVVSEHDESDVENRVVLNANEFILKDEMVTISSTSELLSEVISISPNPATERMTVNLDLTPESILIFNSTGQLVQTIAEPQSRMELSVSELEVGRYTVIVQTELGLIAKHFSKL